MTVGSVGNTNSSLDNVECNWCNETNVLNFLLDSGAISSFISKGSFERCGGEQVLPLQHGAATVKDVDCKSIKNYGQTEIKLKLWSFVVTFKVIVCDISIEGILDKILF